MTARAAAALIAAIRDRVLAGYNNYGQLGDGTNTNSNVPTAVSTATVTSWLAISAGQYHTCGLAADSGQDGKAYCWGESPPRPAMSPRLRQVQRLRMRLRRWSLLDGTASSQAGMPTASWATAPWETTRTYPRQCPPPQSPSGARSRPAVPLLGHLHSDLYLI